MSVAMICHAIGLDKMKSPLRGAQEVPTNQKRKHHLHLAEVLHYPLRVPKQKQSTYVLCSRIGAPLRVYVEPSAYTLFLSKKIGVHYFIWRGKFW